MKAISITCPKCHETSDLYLGSEAFMIVLNCPGCAAPLMYYYGNTVEVNEMQIEQIQKSGLLRNAGDLLKEISKCGIKMGVPRNVKPYKPVAKLEGRKAKIGTREIKHSAGQPVRAEYFSKDDLLNLKIELGTCTNVADFLSRI